MRLADRLFAFWRFPAWTDAVQVLLWLIGWSVLAGPIVLFAPMVRLLPFLARYSQAGASETLMLLALTLSFLMVVGWTIVGAWFVSEALRTWRQGHPYGTQWSALIGLFLIGMVAPYFLFDMASEDVGRTALACIRAALGCALLVALLTTRRPAPPAIIVDRALDG